MPLTISKQRVNRGGTGVTSLTTYAPIFGGTTSTGPVQSGAAGNAGEVLTSNGASALPTFQAASGGGVVASTFTYTNGGNNFASSATTFVAVTNFAWTVPTTGTYIISPNITGRLNANGGYQSLFFRLYNATTATAIDQFVIGGDSMSQLGVAGFNLFVSWVSTPVALTSGQVVRIEGRMSVGANDWNVYHDAAGAGSSYLSILKVA